MPSARRISASKVVVLLASMTFAAVGCSSRVAHQVSRLILSGDSRVLRERAEGAPPSSPDRPPILILALDGVGRSLLYDMLSEGSLPALGKLLGAEGTNFPHAYFDESRTATLPSSTISAWVTEFTGVGPAYHGIAGNEFFIRNTRELVVPITGAVNDGGPGMACFTEDYLDQFRLVPSVYERMRKADPDVLIWSAMQHFHAGADRLLLTDRTVLATSLRAFTQEQIEEQVSGEESREMYANVDGEIVDEVTDELEEGPLPDVLAVYISGTDQFAHVAEIGPDAARREYLIEVVDPLIAELAEALEERDALRNRYVVVVADHGHTQVLPDDKHSLATDGPHEPPEVLRRAGFRVRPFQVDVAEDDDFQSVITYQGAMAYVYVADRSTCAGAGQACDWARPPRYREDVLAAADAFYRNNSDGSLVPEMRGALDVVLTRRPKPYPEKDLPFAVYVGNRKLISVGAYLKSHPHPTYVDLDRRLRELGVGPAGERAGDVLLIANNGNRAQPEERYYFSPPFRSHHGSPGKLDSEIPLIVANPNMSAGAIEDVVERATAGDPSQQKIADVILGLRLLPAR